MVANQTARKISPDGLVTTVAATKAGLSHPDGATVDASGNLFVTCESSGAIVRLTPGGISSILARIGGAPFFMPYGGTVDPAGNFYIAGDTWTSLNTIRRVSPAGVITTIAGATGQGFADGAGSAARFYAGHSGITVDARGNIYVADNRNNVIRKGVPFAVTALPQSQSALAGTSVTLRQPPQITAGGAIRLLFQDADGGTPYDLTQVLLQWRTNLPSGTDTTWQTLAASFYLTNGLVAFDDTNFPSAPSRFYRVIEQ